MSFIWKRNAKLIAKITIACSLLGSAFSTIQGLSFGTSSIWQSIANGLVDGSIISFCLSFYSLGAAQTWLRSWMASRSFLSVLSINTLSYGFLILTGRALGRTIMGESSFSLLPESNTREDWIIFYQAVGVALVASFLINFSLQIRRLLGPGAFLNFISGRYHSPRSEKRAVLFLDLAGSTTIAEQIGDTEYLNFLNRFFSDFSEPILASQAEIYKYVGDEIILTWPLEAATLNSRCLLFLDHLEQVLAKNKSSYEERFGFFPAYRAGLHGGTVVTGEMGELKQELVHVGDLMNTTARIAGHCRQARERILISDSLLNQLEVLPGWTASSIGDVALRGKELPVRLSALRLQAPS